MQPSIIKWREKGSTVKHGYYINIPERKQTKQHPEQSQAILQVFLIRKILNHLRYGWKII